MTDFHDPEYADYLQDQRTDQLSCDYDQQYLDLLTKHWLPAFDYRQARILDVGSRTFGSWEYFHDRYNNRPVGIDICAAGLAYCKEHGKTGMIELDAHRMLERFAPQSFDLVTAFHCFEHMYDLPQVLRNCQQVLRAGGYLYFALPIPSVNWRRGHWYDVADVPTMLQMCQDAGFATVLASQLLTDCSIRPEQELLALVQTKQD